MEELPNECPNCERLERRVWELEEQVQRLTALLDESRRAGKRQAAPFRKPPVPNPQKPGRKPGEDYGTHERRAVPAPDQIDEVHDAPLPECCPDCGSAELVETSVEAQYQIEIPRRPIQRQFQVHVGQCTQCGTRVQGRHALQTSDALGAAAVQLGPDGHAALALLNKDAGLSHGKAVRLLRQLFGIRLARATSVRSLLRTAKRLEPAGDEVRQRVRSSPTLVPDETGWRVGGAGAWLHVFATPEATWYEIDSTRSADPLATLIGWRWAGTLIHDGWAPYQQFWRAKHQQCLAHLLRRTRELLETARGGAVRFPRAAKRLLQRALLVRDRWHAGRLSDHGCAVLRGRLTAALERLVTPVKRHPRHETLAAFLERHLDQLFTFLKDPQVDATNWRAEQALRPAVVNRKVWGGNRTWRGAHAQSLVMSILRTCHQQSRDPLEFLSHTLRSTTPIPLLTVGR